MGFLQLKGAKVHYPIRGGFFNTVVDVVHAVDGVDIDIEEGKTYGLIGESGSGKTTIGKVMVGLEKLTAGTMYYNGKDVTKPSVRRKMKYNKDVQMIFQDVMSSLDPKKRIRDVIAEPLRNFENLTPDEELKKIYELLDIVGMPADAIYKYPHEFSGGQRQRIGVARSVACKPKLIVADEPVSALDLSVQAQVLNYMKEIQRMFNLTYVFISHDLGVVKHMCDHIYIMTNGRFVETGTRDDIYKKSGHIYTKRLIAAIPSVDPTVKKQAREEREKVEQEFREQYSRYFGRGGKVHDLKKVSETHYIAEKKEA